MKIGYARVSTPDQQMHIQLDALLKVGCEHIVTDEFTGSASERPGLSDLGKMLRSGDTLVVWRLDRLGRSVKHLIEFVNALSDKNIQFQSLQESIDTTSAAGKFMFHMFASLAEFERNLIRERTKAGLAAARARGRLGGAPKKLDSKRQKVAIELYNSRQHSVKTICRLVGISAPTLYNYLKESKKTTLENSPQALKLL